jgi:hypothetical protein
VALGGGIDADELVCPVVARSSLRVDIADHVAVGPGSTRLRHWKQPFWKRRSAVRRSRALQERWV